MGKSLDRSPTGVEVWPNVNMPNMRRGLHLIYWPKQPGEGREQTFLILFLNQSDPKILHCAIECVTLCWSASEGLSPQLGKEASLLPSNTIHTLLTLLPTRPQSSSALPSWHSLSSYHIAPWVTMSGVYDQCMSAACPDKTPQIESLFSLPPRGGRGSETPLIAPPIRKRKTTTPAEEVVVEADRAQTLFTVVWISAFHFTH